MRHCNPPNATLGRRQERSDGASLEHRRCLLWVIFGLQRDPERCPLDDHQPARRRSEATSEKCPKRLRGAVKFPEVLPDGQISKNSCQSPLKKIFLFSIDPDSVQNSSIPSRERGVGHGHERWDGLRWTRQRCARKVIAGRFFRERSTARRRTTLKRTAKPCGPGTRCWCQVDEGTSTQPGFDVPPIHQRR